MTGTPLVVLDACVLAKFSLCDTLLRLAEPTRLYEPWSFYIFSSGGSADELGVGDFAVEFLQKFGVLGHLFA